MKANEAPEKIWVRQDTFRIPWPSCIDENANYGGIEYTRTDAFIEKACEWLKNKAAKYVVYDESEYHHYAYKTLTEDFKQAMEE